MAIFNPPRAGAREMVDLSDQLALVVGFAQFSPPLRLEDSFQVFKVKGRFHAAFARAYERAVAVALDPPILLQNRETRR